MGTQKLNIAIIAAGDDLTSLMESLIANTSFHITGVLDTNGHVSEIKPLQEAGIPITKKVSQLLSSGDIDIILQVPSDPQIEKEVQKHKPAKAEHLKAFSATLLIDLIIQKQHAEQEAKKTKEELDLQTWGLKKTNDAIKILYKELEKKNEELQKLDQLKSDFVSTVSHELRTPLTTIREAVAQISEGLLGPTTDMQKEFLNICMEDVDRLTRIINNLLDISKIEAGKIELKRELIDIRQVIDSIVAALGGKAKEKGLELKSRYPDVPIYVYADQDKLKQIFVNLINNALKFTQKGHIEISAIEREHEYEFAVSDTGIGISEEDLEKTFGKFQQFGRISGAGEKGTGLGLSISKGLIELHKGRIWVESEYGQGTQFIFTLPKHTPESFLEETLRDSIEDAKNKDSQVSMAVILLDTHALPSAITVKQIKQDMNDVIRKSLRQAKDVFLELSNGIVIVVSYCEKENITRIQKRLMLGWEKYLAKESVNPDVAMTFRWITFPDDASCVEDFLDAIDEKKTSDKSQH